MPQTVYRVKGGLPTDSQSSPSGEKTTSKFSVFLQRCHQQQVISNPWNCATYGNLKPIKLRYVWGSQTHETALRMVILKPSNCATYGDLKPIKLPYVWGSQTHQTALCMGISNPSNCATYGDLKPIKLPYVWGFFQKSHTPIVCSCSCVLWEFRFLCGLLFVIGNWLTLFAIGFFFLVFIYCIQMAG